MKISFSRLLSVILVALMLVPLFAVQASAATTFERKLGVPVDYQYNYKTVRYGTNKSTASSGCGAASASMVVEYFTGNTSQNPDTLFKWACDNGWYTGSGLSYSAVKKLCSNYGVTLTWVGTQNEIINALKAGNPVIALMGPGTFTSGGHYIVLSGIKIVDGTTYIRVNDPNSSSRTNNYYTLSLIWSEKRTTSSTPFGVCTYSSAPKGKVSDFYVEPGKYSKVYSSDGSLNIRSSASSSGSILGTIPSGTFIKVQSISGNWSYVTYNGISGYVSNSYLKDGGEAAVAAPTITVASTLAYGATASVSWASVASATSYTYKAVAYPGEISAGNGVTVASGSGSGTSFTIPAQSSGKYIRVTVTANGATNSASSTADIMVGPWVGTPSDVQYIPVAEINSGTSTSNSTIWTAAKGTAFTATYWDAFVCSANADGTYTVKSAYKNSATKSITVSGTDILFAIHESYTNFEYANNIVVGDKLTLCGIYLDKATIRGSGHILVNGGIPLAPKDITSAKSTVSKVSSTAFRGFTEKTTIANAITAFAEDEKYLEVRNAGGVAMADTELLCTGYTVNIVVNGSATVSYSIVVAGDVSGDGAINAADYVAVKQLLNKSISLSGAYSMAADIDNSGMISSIDYIALQGHLNGSNPIKG